MSNQLRMVCPPIFIKEEHNFVFRLTYFEIKSMYTYELSIVSGIKRKNANTLNTNRTFTIKLIVTDGRPKLKWPGKYSADVIKYSILSGRVQDITYW